jgi:hypothetical protein
MRSVAVRFSIPFVAATLLAACATRVPPAAVRWNDAAPVVTAPGNAKIVEGADMGFLSVATDTDVRVAGSLSYDYVRRPYDLYSAQGELIRADVDNQGWRRGEDPVSIALPPGQYVVASVYGTVYRKLQVEIRPGVTTEVSESAMSAAPPVFSR